jgi:hypothetical protein
MKKETIKPGTTFQEPKKTALSNAELLARIESLESRVAALENGSQVLK